MISKSQEVFDDGLQEVRERACRDLDRFHVERHKTFGSNSIPHTARVLARVLDLPRVPRSTCRGWIMGSMAIPTEYHAHVAGLSLRREKVWEMEHRSFRPPLFERASNEAEFRLLTGEPNRQRRHALLGIVSGLAFNRGYKICQHNQRMYARVLTECLGRNVSQPTLNAWLVGRTPIPTDVVPGLRRYLVKSILENAA